VGALGGVPPDPLRAQGTDPVAVARAFDAAWNAHDLDAVLVLFAADAVVRDRWGAVPPAVWETHDPAVVRKFFEDSHDGDNYDTGGLTWASGQEEITAWAAARFAQHHRFVAVGYRPVGATVRWDFQEFVDPFQRTPGVSPTEGTAAAAIRDGTIRRLTLVQSPESVRRHRSDVAVAFDQAMAARGAVPFRADPRGPLSQPRRGPAAAEPPTAAWPMALGGLALLGGLAAARRTRRGLPRP
jgi:hypothetical protein